MEDQVACRHPDSLNSYELICDESYTSELKSKLNTWKTIQKMPFEKYEHLSFGLPDDSTNSIYSYDNEILNQDNDVIGYAAIEAYYNSEGLWLIQLITYYDLKGELVSAKIKDVY